MSDTSSTSQQKDNGAQVLAKALQEVFASPNVADDNLEPANVVDVLHDLARAIYALADAIKGKRE